MTNREKYIESMSDKRLAILLSLGSQIIDNQIDINPSPMGDKETREQVVRNYNEIEKWLSQEVEQTADEMFEELGYKLESEEPFVRYRNKDGAMIFINNESYYKTKEYSVIPYTDEVEIIHKKMEELKNESKKVD